MEKYYEKIKEYHEQDNTTNGNHGPRCENNLQHYLNPVSPPSLKKNKKSLRPPSLQMPNLKKPQLSCIWKVTEISKQINKFQIQWKFIFKEFATNQGLIVSKHAIYIKVQKNAKTYFCDFPQNNIKLQSIKESEGMLKLFLPRLRQNKYCLKCIVSTRMNDYQLFIWETISFKMVTHF